MKRNLLVFAMLVLGVLSLSAKDINVVIPQLSPQATETYKQLIVAIIEATGNAAKVQVLPFARCIYLMETGQADVESTIVQLPDQKKWAALKYDYSTVTAVKVAFVLYTNKNKPIDVSDLKQGNPKGYKIETDSGHVNLFGFTAAPSTNIDGSLKKLDAGNIDAYLFAQGSTDAALKRLALKNISRQSFDTFNGVFMLTKGGRGGEIDKIVTDGMAKIKANGKYQQIMGGYIAGASNFVDWQP